MAELLQAYLEMEGFQVGLFTGSEPVEHISRAIQAQPPALILMDVHLGEVDAFTLLRQMRALPALHQTRILLSSGIDMAHESLEIDADGFIQKPYMPDDLLHKIQHILGT